MERTEELRGSSAEFLATTLRSIGDGIITTDDRGRVTFINRTAEMLTGFSCEEAIGHPSEEVFRIVREDSREIVRCPVQRVLGTGEPTGYLNHTLIIDRAGDKRPISYSAAPVQGPEGTVHGVVLVFHCVKDRVAAANATERLMLVAKATNEAVWDWDLLSDCVWWSESVTTVFGWPLEDVAPTPEWLFERIHPDDRKRVQAKVEEVRTGSRAWQDEFRFHARDGGYAVVFLRGYVLRDPLDRPIRLVATMMDVTARRTAQDELFAVNAELERLIEERTHELKEANRELESFSYSVSHDLKSPLRNIIALSRILEEDNADRLDEQSRQNIARLIGSAHRMSKLIDDLLAYSRLSRARLHLTRVDLSALARLVAGDALRRSESRATVEVEPNMYALCDPDLVQILLENLIGNALKFSTGVEAPKVEVGQTTIRDETYFFVRDNGIGFDPAHRDRLFVAFERLHSDVDFQGTGIGLSNVARIVRRHGGKVWADGEVGKGATFYFTL